MPIAPKISTRNSSLWHIVSTLVPLFEQEDMMCDERQANNIYRLLKSTNKNGEFHYIENSSEYHEYRSRTSGKPTYPAKAVIKAFESVFGENYDINGLVDGTLRLALLSFSSFKTSERISPKDLKKAKRFFRVWKEEVEEHLQRPGCGILRL